MPQSGYGPSFFTGMASQHTGPMMCVLHGLLKAMPGGLGAAKTDVELSPDEVDDAMRE